MPDQYDPKEHFTDDGKSAKITHLPQCVGCAHNLGLMNCAALGQKTERILQNLEDCPEREEE
jgi:hypothetical protein